MALTEMPVISPVRPSLPAPRGDIAGPTVIPVLGEHDMSTAAELAAVLAQAIAQDDSAVVVDLGGVTFMDASTLGVLVRASGFLGARARTFSVRSPSPWARRVLEIGDLDYLIEAQPARPSPPLVTNAA
jgi:anti-sigma B factor antagonist